MTPFKLTSQTSIILNVQQKLDNILTIQNVIVQNQHDMYDKLNDIETRLVNVESRIFRQSQQMPTPSKSGLLQPQMGSQILLPQLMNLRLPHKRPQDEQGVEEADAKDQESEKRGSKRAKSEAESPDDEVEEGEVNAGEDKNPTEPGASSRNEDEFEEETDAEDDDDQSSESSSNLTFSKSTPPLGIHRSSMPQHILQSLTSSNLLLSFQQQQMNDLTLLATDETTGRVLLEESEIRRIFANSKSRGNFSALLVTKLYSREERVVSNVMGTRGKRQLSPHRMSVVRRLSFSMYPVKDEREEEMVWKKECVKAIDSKNRKVRTHGVKTEPSSAPPGGIPSTPPSGSLVGSLNRAGLIAANTRLMSNRHNFGMGLNSLNQNPAHSSSSNSANALAIAAMAAAAAAAVASNQGNRSPKVEAKFPTDYSNNS